MILSLFLTSNIFSAFPSSFQCFCCWFWACIYLLVLASMKHFHFFQTKFYNFWFLEVFIAFEFVLPNFWRACGNWNNQKIIVFAHVEFPFSVWQWEIQVDEDKALKVTWSRTIQDNITTLSKISLTVMWRVCHYDQEKLSWRKSIEILPQWNPSCFIFKSYHA